MNHTLASQFPHDLSEAQILTAYLKFLVIEELEGIEGETNTAGTRRTVKSRIDCRVRELIDNHTINDFTVICDESNNTPHKIDMNLFEIDLYVKPKRSVEMIRVNVFI